MRKNTIKVHYTPKQVLAKDSGGNFSKSPLKPKRLLENFEASSFSLALQDVAFMNTFNEGFRICDDPIIFI